VQRLFVAVWPPAGLVDALDGLALGEGVRRVRPQRLHVTLRFLGDPDAAVVVDALGGIDLPAAVARVGGTTRLLGRDALVVPVDGLAALAAAVGLATAHLGVPSPDRFVGHLTVGRVRRRARPPAVDVPTSSFPVESVELVRSVHGADGPTYTTLHTWLLGAT
jgi:RNA 2',3'-cyclic 3'-phosphodiesterase